MNHREVIDDGDYCIYRMESDFSFFDLWKYINIIKNYLEENTEYSLSPGQVPADRDFTEYFLFEGKKGYCTYYAATAAIAFRSLGVPARYVEGFKASKQDIDNARNNGDGTITFILKDVNAHAWVEIYIDGYGWYPLEVTPGYEMDPDAESMEGALEHENPYQGNPEGNFGIGELEKEPEPEPEEEYDPGEYDPYEWEGKKPEGSGNGREAFIKENRKRIALFCILVGALLGILAFTAVRIWKYRVHKKLSDPVLAKRALYLYHMLEKKLKRKASSHAARTGKDGSLEGILEETGGKIKIKAGTVDLGEELFRIQSIGEKACFSGKDISREEWEEMKRLCGKVRNRLQKRAKVT